VPSKFWWYYEVTFYYYQVTIYQITCEAYKIQMLSLNKTILSGEHWRNTCCHEQIQNRLQEEKHFSSTAGQSLTRNVPSEAMAKQRTCDVCPTGCFSLPLGPRGITCTFLPVLTLPEKQISNHAINHQFQCTKQNYTKWSPTENCFTVLFHTTITSTLTLFTIQYAKFYK